jgi:phage gpG-like protein
VVLLSIYINITLDGVGTVKKRINKITGKIKDLKPAFEKIGDDFRKTEDRVFKGQGYYGSRPGWKPLSPEYRSWKDKHYPGKPILQMTGDLRNSLATKGKNHVQRITKNSITLGSNDPKFKWHQNGTSKMVARPPITFTKYQGEKWAKIVRDEILKGL